MRDIAQQNEARKKQRKQELLQQAQASITASMKTLEQKLEQRKPEDRKPEDGKPEEEKKEEDPAQT